MIDYNCYIGNWPFHKLRKNKFSDILRMHRENDIDYGYISKIESVFYNDSYESEYELYSKIKGSGYKQVMTLNPTLDTCINTLKRGIKSLKIKGVRLAPCFHSYSINDDLVKEIIPYLKEYDLPLFINIRFEDERLSYLLHPNPVPMDDVKKFINDNKDIEIILCTISFHEVLKIKEDILGSNNVYFDTSGFKDKLFAMPEIRKEGLSKRARFGSMAPIFCFESSYLIYNEED